MRCTGFLQALDPRALKRSDLSVNSQAAVRRPDTDCGVQTGTGDEQLSPPTACPVPLMFQLVETTTRNECCLSKPVRDASAHTPAVNRFTARGNLRSPHPQRATPANSVELFPCPTLTTPPVLQCSPGQSSLEYRLLWSCDEHHHVHSVPRYFKHSAAFTCALVIFVVVVESLKLAMLLQNASQCSDLRHDSASIHKMRALAVHSCCL